MLRSEYGEIGHFWAPGGIHLRQGYGGQALRRQGYGGRALLCGGYGSRAKRAGNAGFLRFLAAKPLCQAACIQPNPTKKNKSTPKTDMMNPPSPRLPPSLTLWRDKTARRAGMRKKFCDFCAPSLPIPLSSFARPRQTSSRLVKASRTKKLFSNPSIRHAG
jgi:hypothetical protein